MEGGENRSKEFDYYGFGPLCFYLGLSVLFFGRSLLGHPTERYLGAGADPSQFMWYLRWWPYALAHHLNPFLPRVIWAPTGVDIAWAASIPLPSLLAYPLTATIGLIPTFNLLSLLCPALAGWATFLLCRLITNTYWPAIFGGFIFAFSAHMLGKTFGNLNDALVFPIPLTAYVGLLRLAERISVRRFVILLALLLATQFLCFIELFATMTFVAGITMLLAIALAAGATRQRLIALIPPIILGYLLATIIISPYLYFLLAHMPRQTEIMLTSVYSIDLLNFFLPTPLNQLGELQSISHLTSSFICSLVECGGYIGFPLIAIAILFARRYRHEPWGRVMIDLLLVLLLLALGPHLQIMGRVTAVGLPWLLLGKLPLIQKALPARFMLYAFLDLAIMASIWLSETNLPSSAQLAAAGITMFSMLPNLAASYWTTAANMPEFFAAGRDRQYLTPGENVLIMPDGIYGDAMLWQAEADFRFNLVQGWTGFPGTPPEFENWPMVTSMLWGTALPDAPVQLKAFLANYDISTIIVAPDCACVWELNPADLGPQWWRRASVSDHDRQLWSGWFGSLGAAPVEAGGVVLYRVPLAQLARYRRLTALQMQSAEAGQRFAALLKAAAQYVAAGHDLADLTPLRAVRLKLLPADWISYNFMVRQPEKQPLLNRMLLTRGEHGNDVAVGVIASAAALRPLLQKYGADATEVRYFSTDLPVRLLPKPDAAGPILLVLSFNRATLARLAAAPDASPAGSGTPASSRDRDG